VAVHNEFMAEAIREEVPAAAVARIPMGVEPVAVRPEAVRALRDRLGLRPDECVVGSFGLLTREKQVATVARAVARAEARGAAVRLMLVGPVPDRPALDALLARLGPRRPAVVTGRVPFSDLALHIEAADVVAHLRYPTARETSAALLRVLAQGRPTVISDLEHLGDIPSEAMLRADLADEEGDLTRAILRLAEDAAARAKLARAAAAFAAREHSPARCQEGYLRAIALALSRPASPPSLAWPRRWLSLG
jgi:glycosyltransferase involved in cell wall biosynthesis